MRADGGRKDRAGDYKALSQQIEDLLDAQRDLRTQTERLTLALRAPQVRGRWRELQLRRVVELAGMLTPANQGAKGFSSVGSDVESNS